MTFRNTRKTVALSAALVLGATAFAADKRGAAPTAPIGAPTVHVKILAFNDFHGNLESPGTFGVNTGVPTNLRPAVGGAEYIAAHVALIKNQDPAHTIVVGGGDFIGASPLISALFFDEPAVETLNQVGVDFSSVGNHEFDKGKDELKRLQNGGCKIVNGAPDPNSCRGYGSATPGTFDGAHYKWLAANVVEDATGRTLLPAYGIKTIDGVRIAFIGMTLEGTPGIVTPTGVAGLTFKNEAETVNQLVPKLRALGAEAIVVLVHQGGFQLGGNSDINGCTGNLRNSDGSDSDIGKIVSHLDDAVDLVVSAHTHAAYNCSANTVDNGSTPRPTGLPNKAGRLVPVTSASAFGRVLTDVDLTLDKQTGQVLAVSPTNRLIDRTDPAATAWVVANPRTAETVAAYRTAVSPLANAVVGTITAGMSNGANAAGEMPAGDLIADAQLQATQPADLGGAVIAFMNAGGVRSPGFVAGDGVYPHNLTYGEAFTVQPFGNTLVSMTLTAQQIKDVLEQQFVGCLGQGTQRVMQISNGFSYTWSNSAAPCSKVTEVSFTPKDLTVVPPVVTGPTVQIVSGGVVLNPKQTFRVTVNNFMATGGDGFTTFIGGGNQLGGAQDIDALIAYLANYLAPAAPYNPADPVLAKPRITRAN